jgi:hypothetical protein
MNLEKVVEGIVKAHITKHQGNLDLINIRDNNFLAIVSHSSLSSKIEEHINLIGLPEDIAMEYMHCKIHALAAKLIAKLYPEKVFP